MIWLRLIESKGANLTISAFLIELAKKLLETTSTIEAVYDNMLEFELEHVNVKTISATGALVNVVSSVGIHNPDDVHISAAFTYQTSCNQRVVFATMDYGILDKKQELWSRQVRIELSDPLYAFYHF